MECLSSTPGVELSLVKQREPKNIAIGGEALPEIAYLSSESGNPYSYIANDKSAVVSCAINSKFRQLNLVVGINGKHAYARQNDKIIFEVSLDNKVVVTKDLTVASKQVMNINVQNGRSIGIKAICTNHYYSCPYVAFVEASLR
jgi:tRNA U34 5-carboxymethylaminomethyl modifying enzyme MnmG/GidA